MEIIVPAKAIALKRLPFTKPIIEATAPMGWSIIEMLNIPTIEQTKPNMVSSSNITKGILRRGGIGTN